jgi:subtilisin family serine protease
VIITLRGDPLGPARHRLFKDGTRPSVRDAAIKTRSSRLTAAHDRFRAFLERLEPGSGQTAVEYKYIANGFATRIARSSLSRLRAHPLVESVAFDQPVELLDGETNAYLGVEHLWQDHGVDGTGVTVAIIDSGIDYTHPDLGGGFGPGHKVVGGYDFLNGDADPMDDYGHGTAVAGILAADGEYKGVAPKASLLAYKVANPQGYWTSIGSAMDRAVDPDQDPLTDDHADVINLSLGSTMPYHAYDQMVANTVEAGAVVVGAIGNSGPGYRTVGPPAAAPRAVGVGWCYVDDTIADPSSRGPAGMDIKPDIVAPGTAWSTKLGGGHGFAGGGTSFASPHVAGVAALLVQGHPEWSPDTVRAALVEKARALPGYDVFSQGAGVVAPDESLMASAAVFPTRGNLGWVDASQHLWVGSHPFTLVNLTTSTATYDLTVQGDWPTGVSGTVQPSSVSVTAEGSTTVTMEVTVDNLVATDPPDPTHHLEGKFVATSADEVLRVPFVLYMANTPPAPPWIPKGPEVVDVDAVADYLVGGSAPSASDLHIRYELDWGDGTTSTVEDAQGDLHASHVWDAEGTYAVGCQAVCVESGARSQAATLTVAVSVDPPNHPPSVPALSGLTTPVTPGQTTGATVVSHDPEWHDIDYQIDWDDGTSTSSLTEMGRLLTSGESYCTPKSWSAAGVYEVRARAVDELGLASLWTSSVPVTVDTPPAAPGVTTDANPSFVDESATFSFSSTDADGHQLSYVVDWGDETTAETGLADSGAIVNASHSWSSLGTMQVTVRAKDTLGALSEPTVYSMNIASMPNVAITGPTHVSQGDPSAGGGSFRGLRAGEYIYYVTLQNEDGRGGSIEVDWGDTHEDFSTYIVDGGSEPFWHVFSAEGTYQVKVRAMSEVGVLGPWSSPLEVVVEEPRMPAVISGPALVAPNMPATYSTIATDPCGGQISYVGRSWPLGGTTEEREWGPVPSDEAAFVTYTWSEPAAYMIRTYAFDESGAWVRSPDFRVLVDTPPSAPEVACDANPSLVGQSAIFTFSSTDADGHQLSYIVDWGDETTSETGLADSGAIVNAPHCWSSLGTMQVTVRARDTLGALSEPTVYSMNIASMPSVAIAGPGHVSQGDPSVHQGFRDRSSPREYIYYVTLQNDDGRGGWIEVDWGDTQEDFSTYVDDGGNEPFWHVFSAQGTYQVKVRAMSEVGVLGPWSDPLEVVVEETRMPAVISGPTLIDPGTPATYSTISTDPCGGQISYVGRSWPKSGGTIEEREWGPVSSGEPASVTYAWSEPAAYIIRTYALDEWGAFVRSPDFEILVDTPPDQPFTPSGPATVTPGDSAEYTFGGSDQDGQPLSCTVDWGDGTTESLGPIDSGATTTATHTWSESGHFAVTVVARDSLDVTSAVSQPLSVLADSSPDAPVLLSGPRAASPGVVTTFAAATTDPDADMLIYTFDWDDGNSSQTPPTDSGATADLGHSWTAAGVYHVRAQAADQWGLSTLWSDVVTVTVSSSQLIYLDSIAVTRLTGPDRLDYRVTVLTQAAQPLVGARVSARLTHPNGSTNLSGTTDASGTARLVYEPKNPPLATGTYFFQVTHVTLGGYVEAPESNRITELTYLE